MGETGEDNHCLNIVRDHILCLTQFCEKSLESGEGGIWMTIGRDHDLHHHLEVSVDLEKFLSTICILESLDKIGCHMLKLVLMQDSGGKGLVNSPKNLGVHLHPFNI